MLSSFNAIYFTVRQILIIVEEKNISNLYGLGLSTKVFIMENKVHAQMK